MSSGKLNPQDIHLSSCSDNIQDSAVNAFPCHVRSRGGRVGKADLSNSRKESGPLIHLRLTSADCVERAASWRGRIVYTRNINFIHHRRLVWLGTGWSAGGWKICGVWDTQTAIPGNEERLASEQTIVESRCRDSAGPWPCNNSMERPQQPNFRVQSRQSLRAPGLAPVQVLVVEFSCTKCPGTGAFVPTTSMA